MTSGSSLALGGESGVGRMEPQRAARSVVQKILAILACLYVACLFATALALARGAWTLGWPPRSEHNDPYGA